MTDNVEPTEIVEADLEQPQEDLETSAISETDVEDQNDETIEEDGEDDTKKNSSGFDKRVSKLTKRAKDAEFEANYWKMKALEVDNKSAVGKPEVQEPRKPTFADSGDIEIYAEQMAEWTAQKAVRAALAERDTRRSQDKVQTSFATRVNDFIATHSDYNDLMRAADDVPTTPEIMEVIQTSDVGPAIAYHLAKNHDLVHKLNSMSPLKRMLELGKLEDKLSVKSAAPKKEVSKAPVPNKPVTGKVQSNKKLEDMSPAEFIAFRNANDRSRR